MLCFLTSTGSQNNGGAWRREGSYLFYDFLVFFVCAGAAGLVLNFTSEFCLCYCLISLFSFPFLFCPSIFLFIFFGWWGFQYAQVTTTTKTIALHKTASYLGTVFVSNTTGRHFVHGTSYFSCFLFFFAFFFSLS